MAIRLGFGNRNIAMGILAHISLTVFNFSNVVKVNTNNHQHCIDKGSYQSEQKVWSKLLSHSSSRAFMVKKFQWRVDFIFEKHPPIYRSFFWRRLLSQILLRRPISEKRDFLRNVILEVQPAQTTILPDNFSLQMAPKDRSKEAKKWGQKRFS